jgi:hypothetical protein
LAGVPYSLHTIARIVSYLLLVFQQPARPKQMCLVLDGDSQEVTRNAVTYWTRRDNP